MRSYEAARGLFSFLGFCSWFVIIVGGIVAFGGMSVGSSLGRNAGVTQALIGAAPGFILSMAGLYGLALVQMGRAGVDSAEYAQQALKVARDQLEVSRQVLQLSKSTPTSYAALTNEAAPNDPAMRDSTDTTTYATRQQSNSQARNEIPAPSISHQDLVTADVKEAAVPQIEHKNGAYVVGDQIFQRKQTAKAYVQVLITEARNAKSVSS